MAAGPVRDVLTRIGGFSAAVGVSTVLGVIAIPLLVAGLGANGWASIALAQTVGQLVGILVAFGWGAVGPSLIAAAPDSARPGMYLTSLVTRGYLFVIGAVIAFVALYLLSRGEIGVAAIGGVAYVIPALNAGWYFVGEARPRRLLFCESFPMAAGTVGGIVLALWTHEAIAFLAFQALGNAFSIVLDARTILRGAQGKLTPDFSLRTAIRSLGGQAHGVTTALTEALYVTVPSIAVQIFVPAYFPTYVLADRFFRYASIAFAPIQQFFQGWVPEKTGPQRYARMNHATAAGTAFGVAGGLAIALLSPLASLLLTGGTISVPFALSAPLGLAFVFVATSGVIGYACLVVLGRARSLAVSTVCGAIIGTPLILVFGIIGLPIGIAWSVAVSECVVATYQFGTLKSTLRNVTPPSSADCGPAPG